jgi:hypothetical protein
MSRRMLALTLLGLGATSCGSSAPEPAAATFTQVYSALFPLGTMAQCDYCHDRPPRQNSNGNLDMGHDQATAYTALVSKASMSSTCGGGMQLVVPGSPDMSLLYMKLSGPPCGDRMPQGGDPITADQLAMVKSWIAAGAANN